MKPKICLCTKNLKEFSLEDYPFDCYEIKMGMGNMVPSILKILKVKEKFEDKDLSLHSQLSRIFSCNEKGYSEFSEAEMNTLKSEIIIAKILGIKQIIFHMKEENLTSDEIKKFNEIINFAKEKGIEMMYENHDCSEKVILNILETFPKINFCLDMGHLNIAIHRGKFKMNLEKFIEKVKSKIIRIHAHNNYGKEDSHNSLKEGNFPWREILDKLKNQNVKKIIIECKTKKDIFESKGLLEEYYSQQN